MRARWRAAPGPLVDREAGARDLRPALEVDDVERLGDLPVRPALPGAGGRVGVGAHLAGVRHDAREQLAPGPDDDVGVGVADRDARVGRVRDAQEDVVELGPRPRRPRRRAPSIRSPAATEAARSAATSGPSGAAPPRIASPTCFEAAFRSALSASASPRSRRRRASSSRATSTSEASSPLSSAPCRMTLRLLAEPLQPDAHAPASSALAPGSVAGVIMPAGGGPQAGDRRSDAPGWPGASRRAGRWGGRGRRGRRRRRPGRPGSAGVAGDAEEERLPGVAALRAAPSRRRWRARPGRRAGPRRGPRPPAGSASRRTRTTALSGA